MADRNGYIGRAPGDSSVTVARQTFSPTGVTTDFTFVSGYTVGYLDLFLNGTKLIEGVDYNATDASTISLVSAAINGDVLEGVAYKAFNLGDARRIGIQSAGTLVGNVDTLNFVGTGNSISLNGTTIDVSISGGSGGGGAGAGGTWSNYDGVLGVTTTKKVKIQNDLEVIGVTTSGGFVGDLTGNVTGNVTGNISGSTGSFTGNVSVGGTLTYEDVTNVDSVGLITARSGINVTGHTETDTLNVSGLSTFNGNVDVNGHITLDATFGNSQLYISDENAIHLGSQNDGRLVYTNSGNIVKFDRNGSAGEIEIDATPVTLQHSNSTKLQTTSTGITVTGDVTATSFIGNVDTSSSWTLGADGSNSNYTFTGPGLIGAENDPTLYLIRGQTYKFVNNMGAHGFRIQSTPNGSTGTQYNDGITNNDVTNGTLTWDVQFDAPDTLYYQCTAHPNMGGIIYIGSESREIPEVSKSTSYTLITSDTGKFVNITSGNITVPSGTFSPGALVTIYNNKGSTMSITASGTTLRKAGTSNTGTCTVAERGTASILCVASNEFVVAGNIT